MRIGISIVLNWLKRIFTSGTPTQDWIISGDTVVQVASTRRFNIIISGDTVTAVELAA